MANPTHRHCSSRRDKRRANWKGKIPGIITCQECNEPRLAHRICPGCGTYNGRKVIEIIEKEA